MTAYVIEFEAQDEAAVPRFGHTVVAAPTALDAVKKFYDNSTNVDIIELRRVHA